MPPTFGHFLETMGVETSLNSLDSVKIGFKFIFKSVGGLLKKLMIKKKYIKNSAVEFQMCKIWSINSKRRGTKFKPTYCFGPVPSS